MDSSPALPPVEPGLGPLFTMIGGLCLVLALLLIGFWLLRRYGPKGGFGASKWLKYEGSLAIGPRKSVVVVRFLNKVLVLGVTEHQINLLTETEAGHDDPADKDFAKVLDKSRTGDTP